jgi:hypothetical protein
MADVYCYGHVSTGKVLRIAKSYPEPDGYADVIETLENHADEATATAFILRHLGISVALEGNWIGDNPECRRTREFLREPGPFMIVFVTRDERVRPSLAPRRQSTGRSMRTAAARRSRHACTWAAFSPSTSSRIFDSVPE